MTISDALTDWDGAATAPLIALHDRLSGQPDYPATLLQTLPDHPRASTWLLKHYAETQGLPQTAATTALSRFATLTDWQARLHLHQLAELCPPDTAAAPLLWTEALKDTQTRRKILQAWALNSLAIAATLDPARREAALTHLQAAPTTGAIAARVRHALTRLS